MAVPTFRQMPLVMQYVQYAHRSAIKINEEIDCEDVHVLCARRDELAAIYSTVRCCRMIDGGR